jgi:nitroreductase
MNAQPAAAIPALSVLDAIYSRHVARSFSPESIDHAVIDKLLEAAIQAPSAMNQQPWAFAVVEGRERIRAHSKSVREYLLAQMATDSPLQKYRSMLEDTDFNVFYDAPVLILILGSRSGFNSNEDCCLAAQNLMLAARAMGLGTCPIGFARPWLNTRSARETLRLPDDYDVIMPLVVGRPTGRAEAHGRRPVQVVSWIH